MTTTEITPPANPLPRMVTIGEVEYPVTNLYTDSLTFDNPLGDKACTALFATTQDLTALIPDETLAAAIKSVL